MDKFATKPVYFFVGCRSTYVHKDGICPQRAIVSNSLFGYLKRSGTGWKRSVGEAVSSDGIVFGIELLRRVECVRRRPPPAAAHGIPD